MPVFFLAELEVLKNVSRISICVNNGRNFDLPSLIKLKIPTNKINGPKGQGGPRIYALDILNRKRYF